MENKTSAVFHLCHSIERIILIDHLGFYFKYYFLIPTGVHLPVI